MSTNRLPLRRDTRVFISAVSRELGTIRKLVKKALEDSGYHAVEQDNFPPVPTHVLYCNLLINIAARQELVRQNISSFYNSLKI